jgi:hypothetical protein
MYARIEVTFMTLLASRRETLTDKYIHLLFSGIKFGGDECFSRERGEP